MSKLNLETPNGNFGDAIENQRAIDWDESAMMENYANVATISATREEFSLLFGTQRGWRQDPYDVSIALTNRVILNPYLAKRLLAMLAGAVDEYEGKFGAIEA